MKGGVSSSNQRLPIQPCGLIGAVCLCDAKHIVQKTGVSGVAGVSHSSKCLKTVSCGVATPCPRCSDALVYRSVEVYQSQQAPLACWPLEKRPPRRFSPSLLGRGK